MKVDRVLVVDDSVDTTELLAAILQSRGYEVDVAHDGRGALAAVERALPDFVLLDLGLPGIDGFEVARQIRAAHPGGRPHIIAVSGYGTATYRRLAQEAGFDAHLVKPVTVKALLAALASVGTRTDDHG